MASVFTMPFVPALGTSGQFLPGAKLFFYEPGTTTPKSVYTSAALSVAHANPVVADASGRFAAIYLDTAETYRVILQTSAGVEIDDIDDYSPIGANLIETLPQTLSYGYREPIRTIREARTALASLSQGIVGYAAEGGITGGEGYEEYYVDKPDWNSSVENTFGWALAQAKANGGGLIYFDPRGRFDIVVTDVSLFRFNPGHDNITLYAPGRNVTFWLTPLSGSIVVRNQNMIWKNIGVRTLAGPMSGDFEGDGTKIEKILVAVDAADCDLIAFDGCEFRHSSDGALDIAASDLTTASDAVRVTVQNCIFWDTDEVMLIGGLSDTSAATDARVVFATLYNCIFAYCGQRQPKALGYALVDMVNCYTLTQPWQRDQPSPIDEFGACHGASVQNGGHLRARGCLWAATTGADYEATKLVPNPTSGATGYLDVVDCAAENGMTFATESGASVTAAPYTLSHTAVPAEGAERDEWIADRWAAAGARAEAAPLGTFRWTSDATAYPNGETVLVERGWTGRWLRVDQRSEYPPTPVALTAASVTVTSRSHSRTVGYTEGKSSGTAIGPTALDLIGLDSSYFAIAGDGGASDLKFLMSTDSKAIDDGLHLYLKSQSTTPVTLKSLTSITVSAVDTSANSLTVTAHGMTSGDFPIEITSDGTVPAGITSGQQYYAAVVDANTLKLAETYEKAVSGIAGDVVDVTGSGSGTITATIGNLTLPGGTDITLDALSKIVHLIHDSGTGRFAVVTC